MKIDALLSALTRPDDAVAADLDPLPQSWADPDAYRAALAEHVGRWGLGRVRSQSRRAVDPYADTVGRYSRGSAPAMVWHDAARGWLTMPYARLDQLASGLAARWMARGVAPGAIVAIAHDPGPQRLVALMAALRLGAVISLLEPVGEARLPARLAALEPEFIAYNLRRPPPVGDCPAQVLDGTGGDQAGRAIRGRGVRALPPPHAYAADAPLALTFSPVRGPDAHPTPLPAAEAVFGALSDGVVAWRLRPGLALAAPGAHPLQYSPCLELSALLCGATLVHVPWADLSQRPGLLAERTVDVLFISEALGALLQTQPVAGLAVSHWVRPVDAPLDWPTWRALLRSLGLASTPGSNALIDAASGGALLCSAQRPGSVSARALPAPGRRWALLDVTAPGRVSVGPGGLFQTLVAPEDEAPAAEGAPPGRESEGGAPAPAGEPDEANPGWCVLGRQGAEFLYGGPWTLRRSARLYPVAEVEAAVAALPGVEAPCVVGTPAHGDGWFTVLVFIGAPDPARPGPTRDQVRAAIARAVGPDGRPDAVEIVPLYARRAGDEVDRAWCTLQYQSGRLAARVEDDAFTALTALRAALIDSPAASGPR